MRAQEFIIENADQAAVTALQKKHGWSAGTTGYGDLYFTWQGNTYVFYGERMRINWPNGESASIVWGRKPDWQGRNNEFSFAQAVQRKLLKFDLSIWQQLDRGTINDSQALQKFKAENERQAREAIAQGVTEGREKFNQEIMQPGFEFRQEINGVTYEVTNDQGFGPVVTVTDKNNEVIAQAGFWKHKTRPGLESLSTHVEPEWQGQGIAANMYAVMRMLGANISPSTNQTDDGQAMWAKWSRQGDAKHLKNLNPQIKEQTVAEGLSHPVICVDVQPEYNGGPWPPANAKFVQIMNFVQKQTGPVLFFVNAEDQGMSGDSIQQIQQFWDETLGTEGEEGEDENGDYYYNEPESPIDWRRFEIVDKGYGYLRSWMDHGIEPSTIIATIREMYAQRVSDTRDLEFPAFNRRTTTQSLIQGAIEEMEDDPMTVGWTSVAQLKRFNGAYLVGGGRDECLREVELLMNAFNIKYKRIDSLVY